MRVHSPDAEPRHDLPAPLLQHEGRRSGRARDSAGFIPPNDRNVYSFNNVTAKKDADGSVTIQFGGCDGKAANGIPTVPGWNYVVRLYRPRPGAQRQLKVPGRAAGWLIDDEDEDHGPYWNRVRPAK